MRRRGEPAPVMWSLLGTALIGTLACGGGSPSGPAPPPPPPPPPAPVASITLDYPTATLALGQSLTLTPTLRDASGNVLSNRTVAWAAADPTVVQVVASGASGNLVATKAGNTTVTGTADGASATSTVTVISFVSVGPGSVFTCAIATGGKLYCAGTPYPPFAVPVAPQLRFTSVRSGGQPASSEAFACALATDQRAYCWGANGAGQLGTGDLNTRDAPTAVIGGHLFTSISVGLTHACGLTPTGDGYCWGDGSEGRLGTGDVANRSAPAAVQTPGGTKFSQIEAGFFATCGVAVSGQAYCWGRNDLGQLGSSQAVGGNLGDFTLLPVPVDNAATTTQIVTKGPKACLLNQAGRAFCAGDNTVGSLGAATTRFCYGQKPCSTTPLEVQTTQVFTTLAVSQFAACGLTASGQSWCWGLDNELLFGSAAGAVPSCPVAGSTFGCTATPVQGPSGLVTLAAARSTQCGLKQNGVLFCWGGNATGQRGHGLPAADPVPQPFSISPATPP